MKLVRLKYWDSEQAPNQSELHYINIDAITSIHVFTYCEDEDDECEYGLQIGLSSRVQEYFYAHELNRDNDKGAIIKECNALEIKSPNNKEVTPADAMCNQLRGLGGV